MNRSPDLIANFLAGEKPASTCAMSKTYYAKMLNAERLKRVYEIAGPRVRRYLRAEIRHLAEFIGPGDRILELGCGYGRVLAPLAAIAGQGWGIDNSAASLALAKAEHPDLQLAQMDAASLEFSDHSFDLVFGVQNFISACKTPAGQVLGECLRVTRPGGRVLLSSYAERFWDHRLGWFRRQAAESLLGPIDEQQTGDGVIVCEDGFRATTFSPGRFARLAASFDLQARVYEVDGSSLFCEIIVPGKVDHYREH